MQLDIIMPALGMSQDTGVLLAWHKESGDAVTKGDVLLEVETDKTTVEIEAEEDGFLVDVCASAGDEVPVGKVIARISDKPESSEPSASSPSEESNDSESESISGEEIIMPTLGMSQDSGILVNWLKEAGDSIAVGDLIFEVETDKSVVEVASEYAGYLAARFAQAGESVPTGDTIAIISKDKPSNPIDRSFKASTGEVKGSVQAVATGTSSTEQKSSTASQKSSATQASSSTKKSVSAPKASIKGSNGRILASPKARRLALMKGLDLELMVAAQIPQPFHARDVDEFKEPLTSNNQTGGQASRRLIAVIDEDRSAHFLAWAAKRKLEINDTQTLLAGMAAASWGERLGVAVETSGNLRTFTADYRLSRVIEEETEAQLLIRDLRASVIQSVEFGAQSIPAITLTESTDRIEMTLEYTDQQLSPEQASTLISEFAGRLKEPLRHIL